MQGEQYSHHKWATMPTRAQVKLGFYPVDLSVVLNAPSVQNTKTLKYAVLDMQVVSKYGHQGRKVGVLNLSCTCLINTALQGNPWHQLFSC